MSEPVSKAEIEDVLSSIRRLVSENTGAVRRDAAILQVAEKLVLTPAFRVDEGDSAPSEVKPATDQAEDVGAKEEDSPSPEAVVAKVVDAQPDPVEPEAEPEASAASQPVETDAEDEAHLAGPDQPEPEAAAALADTAAKEAAEIDQAPAPRAVSPLEQRIAELEAVVAQSAAEFEPDGSEIDARPERFMFHRHSKASVSEPAPEQADTAELATDAVDSMPLPEPEPTAHMPQPEETPAQTDESSPEDEPNGEADAWEDVEASQDQDAPAAVSEPGEDWDEVTEADTDIDRDAEAVIDEDALRELVSRMVREELQGSVGERITHNVRRMVRREIARALSLQEFE